MPMIEITTTKGALDDAAKQRLAGELSTLVLELEAAPFADFGQDAHMQALTWCFINEQDVFVGGSVHAKPIYRVTVTIPEGRQACSVRSRNEVVQSSPSTSPLRFWLRRALRTRW